MVVRVLLSLVPEARLVDGGANGLTNIFSLNTALLPVNTNKPIVFNELDILEYSNFISSACRRTHCNYTGENDLEVFSTEDPGLDWIYNHNFLTRLQKLSSYASSHLEVSELAACLEKLHFPTLLVMSKFSRIQFSFVIHEVLLSEFFGFDMNYALNFLCSI
ncbi:hypothetical protein Tco_0952131 [Tanacetum coccineum]|uniref:Uncharacterized protein n=1 Tax=Tanacetum coccineum TaxID=301880 RepID=A0ABQ5DW44_9ASTR